MTNRQTKYAEQLSGFIQLFENHPELEQHSLCCYDELEGQRLERDIQREIQENYRNDLIAEYTTTEIAEEDNTGVIRMRARGDTKFENDGVLVEGDIIHSGEFDGSSISRGYDKITSRYIDESYITPSSDEVPEQIAAIEVPAGFEQQTAEATVTGSAEILNHAQIIQDSLSATLRHVVENEY